MAYTLIMIAVLCIHLGVVYSQQFDELHPHIGIDKVTYCEVCKLTAKVLHKLVTDSGTIEVNEKLEEAWEQLCEFKHFKHISDQKQRRSMIDACKHLTDRSTDGHPEMYEMVFQLFDHEATELEIKSGMCHMMSDACLGTQNKLSDQKIEGGELNEETIMKYLDLKKDVLKKPTPVRVGTQLNKEEIEQKYQEQKYQQPDVGRKEQAQDSLKVDLNMKHQDRIRHDHSEL